MKSGIYQILNIVNNKKYIGSSCHIHRRFACHRFFLRRNKHENTHLQRAFNKYGESNFLFEVLELCPETDFLIKEQYFLGILSKDIIYNQREIVESNRGFRHSEETKNKVRESRKGKGSWKKGSRFLCSNITSFKKGMKPWNKGIEYKQKYKTFEVVSPANILYIVNGQINFCQEVNCNYKDFGAMLNGKKDKMKGWRLPKEGDEYVGYGFFGAANNLIR